MKLDHIYVAPFMVRAIYITHVGLIHINGRRLDVEWDKLDDNRLELKTDIRLLE